MPKDERAGSGTGRRAPGGGAGPWRGQLPGLGGAVDRGHLRHPGRPGGLREPEVLRDLRLLARRLRRRRRPDRAAHLRAGLAAGPRERPPAPRGRGAEHALHLPGAAEGRRAHRGRGARSAHRARRQAGDHRHAARHHRAPERRARAAAERGALRPGRARRQRRALGLGPRHQPRLPLAPLEADARPARGRAGQRPGGVVRAGAPRRSRPALRRPGAAPLGRHPQPGGGAPHPPCGRDLRGGLLPGTGGGHGQGNATRMAGSQTDVTERKEAEEKLLHDALHDALTGLPNRSLFMDRLRQAMAFLQRKPDLRFAVLFLDVDRFKNINESLGHAMGDRLLVSVGKRLLKCVRPGDTVARLGGDEFALLLTDYGAPEDPARCAERIQAELAPAHDLGGVEVFATASVGIAVAARGYTRPEELLRDADTAMYRAKQLGRARHAVFHPAMHAHARAQLQLETDLYRALERNELRLAFQPIVSLSTGLIAGCEALVEWQHPKRGRIPPAEFIPAAEETGLILPIGEWVLRESCKAARGFADRLPRGSPVAVSVNLSARQLLRAELLEQVRSALQQSGLEPHLLRLEVTESIIMENAGPASLLLAQIKALGVHLLLDDFGTGYSSLSYLHNFRFDTLKLDRSFVARIDSSSKHAEIVRTILSLARALGMDVVAEGVETPAQVAQLEILHCDYAQGYHFARPMDAAQLAGLLESRHSWPLPLSPGSALLQKPR